MKRLNNNLVEFKGLLTIISIILSSVCCNGNILSNEKKEIIVFLKCSSNEESNDLVYSISQIKEELAKNNISVKMDSTQNKCGYIFIYGKKNKKITSVLTDLELLEEMDKFFK